LGNSDQAEPRTRAAAEKENLGLIEGILDLKHRVRSCRLKPLVGKCVGNQLALEACERVRASSDLVMVPVCHWTGPTCN